jgi:hypothetical protein
VPRKALRPYRLTRSADEPYVTDTQTGQAWPAPKPPTTVQGTCLVSSFEAFPSSLATPKPPQRSSDRMKCYEPHSTSWHDGRAHHVSEDASSTCLRAPGMVRPPRRRGVCNRHPSAQRTSHTITNHNHPRTRPGSGAPGSSMGAARDAAAEVPGPHTLQGTERVRHPRWVALAVQRVSTA